MAQISKVLAAAEPAVVFDDGFAAYYVPRQDGLKVQKALGHSTASYGDHIALVDPSGNVVASCTLPPHMAFGVHDESYEKGKPRRAEVETRLRQARSIVAPRLWLHENPHVAVRDGRHARRGASWTIQDGMLHADGEPALRMPDGSSYWFDHGLLHREDGYALETTGDFWHKAIYRRGSLHADGDTPALVSHNQTAYYKDDLLHREKGFAQVIDYPDGNQSSCYRMGELHCEDGPAKIQGTRREWYLQGKRHRIGAPAFEDLGIEGWFEDDLLHRVGGPAWRDRSKEEWYTRGKKDRKDGPAVTRRNGRREYWRGGERVRPGFVGDMLSISGLIHDAITDHERFSPGDRCAFTRTAATLADAMERTQENDWSPELAGAFATDIDFFDRKDAAGAARVRAFGIGSRMAAGRFSEIAAADREFARAALSSVKVGKLRLSNVAGGELKGEGARTHLLARLAEAPAPQAASGPGQPVRFVFERRLTEGEVRGKRRYVASEGFATLTEVSPDDAPVFARLSTRDSILDIRVFDGEYYRPILRPGSWLSCSEEEFRSASERGDAWVDSPFREGADEWPWPLSVSDMVATASESTRADREVADSEAGRRVAAAGRILCIDGMVFRRTEKPDLVVEQIGGVTRLSWRLQGLSPNQKMNFWNRGREWPGRRSSDRYHQEIQEAPRVVGTMPIEAIGVVYGALPTLGEPVGAPFECRAECDLDELAVAVGRGCEEFVREVGGSFGRKQKGSRLLSLGEGRDREAIASDLERASNWLSASAVDHACDVVKAARMNAYAALATRVSSALRNIDDEYDHGLSRLGV